jgi:hypothetical protein
MSDWGTVNAEWAERNARLGTSSNVIEVNTINFADAIREHGVPYYMKIDVEGCDIVCLSALGGFEERPSYISIESDKTSFANIEREIDLFVDLGYTSFQAVEQSRIPLSQSPPRPPREGRYVAHGFEKGSSGLFGTELAGKWKSRHAILRQYRFVRLGYLLVGDDGIMSKWRFRGAARLRSLASRAVGIFTHAAVPGWYDTHARHSSVDVANSEAFEPGQLTGRASGDGRETPGAPNCPFFAADERQCERDTPAGECLSSPYPFPYPFRLHDQGRS